MSKLSRANPFTAYLKAGLLALGAFSIACNSAAPPRPVGSDLSAQAPSAPNQVGSAAKNEKTVAEAFEIPIARLDGSSFKLADFKGRVMVVDFWATWCGPCVKQAPQLAELSKRYRERGLEVVGLTSDPKSDQEKVSQFMKQAGINYTIGYSNYWVSDPFLKGTEDETGSPPIPQLFIFSRDGRLVEHLIGGNPEHGLSYLEKVVAHELSTNTAAR